MRTVIKGSFMDPCKEIRTSVCASEASIFEKLDMVDVLRFVCVSMPGRYNRLGVGIRLGCWKGTVEDAVVALTSRPWLGGGGQHVVNPTL